MKKDYSLILMISATVFIGISQTVQAQTTVNSTKLFEDKFRKQFQTIDPRVPIEAKET